MQFLPQQQSKAVVGMLGRVAASPLWRLTTLTSTQVTTPLRRLTTLTSTQVNTALKDRGPILALESTIITHGLPFPHNLQMAQSVEEICVQEGCTPATIAIMEGQVKIGLGKRELEELASKKVPCMKVSRRDLAPALQQRATGGTTVSGTMVLAHRANIPVFATGGIGGVHRGGEETLDVSADLTELGRTPVAVVCAGAKSILDIPRTLEYLETQGVTVATFGRTCEFPAFFTAHSGCNSHTNVRSPLEAAQLIQANKELQLQSGIIIAVPIPDQFAADGDEISTAIHRALREALEQSVMGNAITPFVLARVAELTQGRSITTNLALVKNNVKVGSQIAVELSNIRRKLEPQREPLVRRTGNHDNKTSITTLPGSCIHEKRSLLVGAINVDILCIRHEEVGRGKDLARGTVRHVMGGVARNVAESLTRCGVDCSLVSVVGADTLGNIALQHCQSVGLEAQRIAVVEGSCTAVAQLNLKEGNVVEGIADFSAHGHLGSEMVTAGDVRDSARVILDCDVPLHTALHVAQLCQSYHVPLILEPTAPAKFKNYIDAGILASVSMVTPNASELASITDEGKAISTQAISTPITLQSARFSGIITNMIGCLEKMSSSSWCNRSVLTTLGEQGSLLCQVDPAGQLTVVYTPPPPVPLHIVSASGAGDSFLGGFLAASQQGSGLEHAMKVGTACAFLSLQSNETVNKGLSLEAVQNIIGKWESLDWDSDVLFKDTV